MEKQRYYFQDVLANLQVLSYYNIDKYIKENDPHFKLSEKLSQISERIQIIDDAINDNYLSNDDMKVLFDFYIENQERIDKTYLFDGRKNQLENFQRKITPLSAILKNSSEISPELLDSVKSYIERGITSKESKNIEDEIKNNYNLAQQIRDKFQETGFTLGVDALESLGVKKYLDEKLESFESYFNSKNLETKIIPPNCIDAYINGNILSIRKKEDFIELEIFEKETGTLKTTEINSIEDLNSEVNTFLDKLKRKETEKENEFNIDNIENFLNTKDLNTKRITPNCIDIYMDKVDLIIRKENDDITLKIHDHQEKIETETKITSIENLESIINIIDSSIKERKANEFSIDNIENFLNTTDLETKRITPNCVDIYMDKANLTIRQEKDNITLEIYNREKNSITKTKVNDMKNLESIINDVSNNSYRKETEEFLDKIEDFFKKNDFDINREFTSNEMLCNKKNLFCAIENNNGELSLVIDKLSKPTFERLSNIKIESLEDVISEMSKHIDIKNEKVKDTSIET